MKAFPFRKNLIRSSKRRITAEIQQLMMMYVFSTWGAWIRHRLGTKTDEWSRALLSADSLFTVAGVSSGPDGPRAGPCRLENVIFHQGRVEDSGKIGGRSRLAKEGNRAWAASRTRSCGP
jgi:hypothetical protein